MPQRITPYLLHEDVAGELESLARASFDREGQLWSLATRIRVVAPEEWGAERPE